MFAISKRRQCELAVGLRWCGYHDRVYMRQCRFEIRERACRWKCREDGSSTLRVRFYYRDLAHAGGRAQHANVLRTPVATADNSDRGILEHQFPPIHLLGLISR